ncbi:hypothetical protein BDN72DRAFT_366845 [Pluteus cervinus]|uniref:Uncharacterized protein n=1 Tax=Pluteus cervinus TaxID=181527 RepID=A0ACD3BE05_9AGAR|nr:hypothetical protein BDN72DRAFT_366845 [Pluteus cervinus]
MGGNPKEVNHLRRRSTTPGLVRPCFHIIPILRYHLHLQRKAQLVPIRRERMLHHPRAGFALNDLVSAHWQWTVDAQGRKQHNVSQPGVINKNRHARGPKGNNPQLSILPTSGVCLH